MDFCRARGVDGRSLNCWRHNLQRGQRRASPPGLRLVELATSRPPSRPALYRVLVGEFEVEVDDDFRDDTLAPLLAVVGRVLMFPPSVRIFVAMDPIDMRKSHHGLAAIGRRR